MKKIYFLGMMLGTTIALSAMNEKTLIPFSAAHNDLTPRTTTDLFAAKTLAPQEVLQKCLEEEGFKDLTKTTDLDKVLANKKMFKEDITQTVESALRTYYPHLKNKDLISLYEMRKAWLISTIINAK